MLKVCGGEFRGRTLRTPAGRDTRPTSAKVREALMSILGYRLQSARVCDLFAGSGALGIEALSRGAASCVFVERSRAVCALIRSNLESLGLGERGQVLQAEAVSAAQRLRPLGPFDLLLADPPYGKGFVAGIMALAAVDGMLAPGGLVVIEHAPHEPPQPPDGLAVIDARSYGQSRLALVARDE